MKIKLQLILLLTIFFAACSSVNNVADENATSFRLKIEGNDFFIKGMNWTYFPIGQTYTYSLWNQPDSVITAVLDYEMSMLQEIGVNTIRHYTGIPPKWITYIHKNFGIYTVLNHSFGRYGLTLNGKWKGKTDYADEAVKKLLLAEVKQLAKDYKNTSGLLMYLLGNENNYGLSWEGAETENIPNEDEATSIAARNLYKLFNDATVLMKQIDSTHKICICNGDLQYLDIIIEECDDIDVLGVNIYRGESFEGAFADVAKKWNIPVLFTEFGADAFDNKQLIEDQKSQAYYLLNNWKEIYENADGLGAANNSIGGFTFHFSDGWWKAGQTKNLSLHDSTASWNNGGYIDDYIPGKNNISEEWFGVCAKDTASNELFTPLKPREAFYVLKEIHKKDPYQIQKSDITIPKYFERISIDKAIKKSK